MEFSEFITPLLCVISPFAVGWITFSVIAGIRTGWEAGTRLLLLGLGLLCATLVSSAIVVFLPDWGGIPLVLIVGLPPWITTLHYFISIQLGGKLLIALPAQERWISFLSGAVWTTFGLGMFITHNEFLAPPKSYVLGISLVSLGFFKAFERIRCSQIREKGILYESGDLYRWENIENYAWKFGEDKLTLKLKKGFFGQNINLKLLSQFRQEVLTHLSQKIDNSKNNAQDYVPIQKRTNTACPDGWGAPRFQAFSSAQASSVKRTLSAGN